MTTFFDTFTATIDNDTNLEDVQKFQYLKSALIGEAARTIEGLPLSNANYAEALALLKSRYGQKHKVIATYMKALWELPNTNSIEEVKAL